MHKQEPEFYACAACVLVVEVVRGDGAKLTEGGAKLQKLEPGTSDGAVEKHLPDVKVEGDRVTVQVGSVAHPMAQEHSIEWIYLQTAHGGQRVDLCADSAPTATFLLAEGDRPLAAYAYCNLHGFWKTEL